MIDVLIPTFRRPDALAVTLSSLAWQDFREFRLIISDQSEKKESTDSPLVRTVTRLLETRGIRCDVFFNGNQGIAANRDFLLSRSSSGYCLFLDDDIILEPDLIGRLFRMLRHERCGFIGSAPIGLSYLRDVRPHEQAIEFWENRVRPEKVRPGTSLWARHKLHNAANIFHVQRRLNLTPASQRAYKIAWVGSCVMFDSQKLRDCGGFGFWSDLPREACGEDVFAQLKVMEKYGGAGMIPSGCYHQELPTTIPDRTHNAVNLLPPVTPGG